MPATETGCPSHERVPLKKKVEGFSASESRFPAPKGGTPNRNDAPATSPSMPTIPSLPLKTVGTLKPLSGTETVPPKMPSMPSNSTRLCGAAPGAS